MSAPVFNLEQGIKESISRVDDITEKPILVSIYGLPHNGKSHLIKILGGHFQDLNNLGVCTFHGAARSSDFERMKKDPLFWNIYLFHCGWERYPIGPLEADPNILAQNIGKKVHLNIGIYNPKMAPFIIGTYDLVISNPGSVIKIG